MSGGEPAPDRQPEEMQEKARAALADLWEQFREPLGAQVAVLEAAAVAILSGDVAPDLLEQARHEAHKLAGTLGTFGLPQGSVVAREIETELASRFGAGPPDPPPADILRLSDAVVTLRRCLDAGPAPGPAGAVAAPAGTAAGGQRPLLLLVDDDPVLADGLRRAAAARRWDLEVAPDPGGARRLVEARTPAAVLIEADGLGAGDRAFELMGELQAASPPVPVVALTRSGTFTDRLEATRLGVRAFLTKPTTPAQALGAVDDLLDRAGAAGTAVLAVDDDPAVLAAVAALLRAEGQSVTTLDDPLRFWDTLQRGAPDVVLLDVDMPQVSGVELCRVLRADPRWSGLPVVFLTAHTDPATVEAVFDAGADDYVAKPLVGPELVTRISNRLERSRLLRRMAETDLLTGVANQRSSAEAMTALLARGERFGQPVAVAMVDVDRIGSINERYGYAAGDEVLGRLGELLRGSFRGDDVVGRWAGQEFFVGMYGMTRGDGVERLAAVLEDLRGQRFPDGQGGSFGVSFSAGVVQYPDDGTEAQSLYRAADGAVRRAKAAGGDQVVRAGWSEDDATVDVVVVEDDDALAGILLHGLATRAWRTLRFADGQEAADALEGPHPKVPARVVLLDWDLPGLDGLRVLRRLAETGGLARTRIIMLTARAAEREVLAALEVGAFDHVAKPFSSPVLMKRVHRAMQR